jgi:transposase
MVHQQYRVQLTEPERARLSALTRRGRAPAQQINRARIMLLADRRTADQGIADALALSTRTVARIRRRAVEEGVEAALVDRPRPGASPLLDEQQEAFLVALVHTEPPPGRNHWTMQLLADRLISLEMVETISDETVRRTLKKRACVLTNSPAGVSPP